MIDQSAENGELAYDAALLQFDAAVCEALAIGQGSTDRLPERHISWASRIFARVCAHATAMVRAAPRSRWVSSDSEDWNFSVVAPHARAILEGVPFFLYFTEQPSGDAEVSARVNMLHLNDCTRRIDLLNQIDSGTKEIEGLQIQQEQLKARLRNNAFFTALPERAQKDCLKGEKPWLKTRQQLNELAGIDEASFGMLWLLYSQHSHVLPLSFHRIEPNGRGTGLKNDTDQGYITLALNASAGFVSQATEKMTMHFPDTRGLRRGLRSKFRPGPRENNYVLREETSVDAEIAGCNTSILRRVVASHINVIRRLAQ